MASSAVRHVVGIVGWTCLFAIAVALAVWMIVEHYLSVRSALELLGFEQQEMWRDPLVGRVLGAFIPAVTLPQAVALTIAVTEALALVIACELLKRIGRLLRHRRAMRDLGNDAEAREAIAQAWELVALLAVIGGVLVVALRYDFELFRLRAVAGSLGMELPEQVAQLRDWPALAADPDRRYSVTLAQIGAWGYLAFTVLGCFSLHYCPGKIGEHFTKLMAPVDNWIDGGRYADEDVALDDEHVEGFGDEELGEEEYGDEEFAGEELSEDQAVDPRASADGNAVRGDDPVRSAQPGASSSTTPLNTATGATPGRSDGGRPRATPATTAASAQLPVIGGAKGESTTLEAARRDADRYFIEPETGRIWRRAYWNELHRAPKSNGLRREEEQ